MSIKTFSSVEPRNFSLYDQTAIYCQVAMATQQEICQCTEHASLLVFWSRDRWWGSWLAIVRSIICTSYPTTDLITVTSLCTDTIQQIEDVVSTNQHQSQSSNSSKQLAIIFYTYIWFRDSAATCLCVYVLLLK